MDTLSNYSTETQGPFGLTKWQTRLALFLIWTSLGLFEAAREIVVFNLGEEGVRWAHTLTWGLTDWYLWGLLSIVIIRITRAVGFERRLWPWNILLHVGLAVVFGAFQIWLDVLGYRLSLSLFFSGDVTEKMPLMENYIYFLKTMGHTAIIVYFLIALGAYAVNYFRQYRDAELDRARVQAQLAQAQVESFRAKLHPHFLFNALNSISALIHTDAERADRMIARLSDLLRASIENSSVQEQRLDEEIDFLDRYLDIQKMRFEDRLTVSFDISDSVKQSAVPSLILQPLVENAIRHGVSKVSRPILIRISAHSENGHLVVSVVDNGPGFKTPPEQAKVGFGLRSTKERLKQLYGPDHLFKLESQPGGGASIRMQWPLRTASKIDNGSAVVS